MANNLTQSKYFSAQVVRDRNQITINSWAGYVSETAIPDEPDDDWIRQRIQADNAPISLQNMVGQTLAYFQQNTITQVNIDQFINPNNSDQTEVSLAQQNDQIIAAFAPQWCRTTVSDAQVAQWRTSNDKPAPAPAAK